MPNSTVFEIHPCYFDVVADTNKRSGDGYFVLKEWGDAAFGGPIDLAWNPKNIGLTADIKWTTIHADVHMSVDERGETTIGPGFPNKCANVGAVGLTEVCLKALRKRPTLPPDGFSKAKCYEFKSVQYWDKDDKVPTGRRFRGFHAERVGTAQVKIWPPGTSGDGTDPTPTDIDWEKCDSIKNGFSKIEEASPPGTPGALFIDVDYAYGKLGLRGPKLPLGWETFKIALAQKSPSPAYLQELSKKVHWHLTKFDFKVSPELTGLPFSPEGRITHGTFDLVGHSIGPEYLLELSDGSVLDEKAVVTRLSGFFTSPEFKSLGIAHIRLLGCSTAASDAGKRVLKALHDLTGCNVSGTREPVTNADFTVDGFISTHLLVVHTAFRSLAPKSTQPIGAHYITTDARYNAKWFDKLVKPAGVLARPILAIPDLEVRGLDQAPRYQVHLSHKLAFSFPNPATGYCLRYDLSGNKTIFEVLDA
ncbi:MAG: hypothetical protein KF773_07030 [Deltaproteobacteria bacterium]|nr:hypothetical protein [Deltaproteobacteria bacterium]